MTETANPPSSSNQKPTKKLDKKSEKKGLLQSKILLTLWEKVHSPMAMGIYLTIAFIYFAHTFYVTRAQNEGNQKQNLIFQIIDIIDQKTADFRFILRGPKPPEARIALLTLDDRSIEEVGRWPWSREKTAHVVDKLFEYGAKTLAFDIVFSENQVDPTLDTLKMIEEASPNLPPAVKSIIDSGKKRGEPDKVFAGIVEKYRDKIVLGAFNEDSSRDYKPYQDYCRNEAFKRANADKFVKLNATFVVEDLADYFVDLNFSSIFEQIFSVQEQITVERALKNVFQKASISDLNSLEIKQLQYMIEESSANYCDIWLDKEDSYLEPLKDAYLKVFAQSEYLKDLEFQQAVDTFKSLVKSHPVPQHGRWTINIDELQDKSDFTGSFNAEQDTDGTIRKASLFYRTGNRIGLSFIPALSLQTFLVSTGYQAKVEIDLDPKNPEQKVIKKFTIVDPSKDPEEIYAEVPVDGQGRLKINYAGPRSMYPYLPAKELFSDKKMAKILQQVWSPEHKRWVQREYEVDKKEFIKDRSFIFGATAIGIYDLRVTPFEKDFPGPETHLNTLGNLFDRNFLKVHPEEPKVMLWVLGAVGLLFSVAISLTGAIPGFFITMATAVLIFYVDQFMFKKGLVFTTALPALLILFMYIGLTFYKYFTEERKKKHLRSTFSKYVSPAIVDEILKDPENIELGGKKQRMTVMFSDVRGFTTISEKLDPEALSDVLNKYLTPMTDIVFANKGTLDKYMGDAIMAFFGAPIHYPDHAKYACRCALQSIVKLKELQKEFKEQGLPEIDIGIGLNTGEMSVGNMGSETVRSYTVMGDAVNLGSRLEGINKEYGTRIIISQFVYDDVKDSFTAREVDWVRVKGKNEPVRIYELICEGQPDAKTGELIQHFNQGFQLYHEKKFAEALECFKKALAISPNDPPSELYVERCEEYIQQPPPENWDGVFVMKTK